MLHPEEQPSEHSADKTIVVNQSTVIIIIIISSSSSSSNVSLLRLGRFEYAAV